MPCSKKTLGSAHWSLVDCWCRIHCYTLVAWSSPCHIVCISWHQAWPPEPPAVHMFKEKYLEAKVLKARIAKLELWSPRSLLLRHLKWHVGAVVSILRSQWFRSISTGSRGSWENWGQLLRFVKQLCTTLDLHDFMTPWHYIYPLVN